MEQVAEKIGCSVASLASWKRAAKESGAIAAGATEGEEPATAATNKVQPPKKDACKTDTCGDVDLARKFWSKGGRAVDMLLDPKDISPEEAVKLVSEAIQFTQSQLQK